MTHLFDYPEAPDVSLSFPQSFSAVCDWWLIDRVVPIAAEGIF